MKEIVKEIISKTYYGEEKTIESLLNELYSKGIIEGRRREKFINKK